MRYNVARIAFHPPERPRRGTVQATVPLTPAERAFLLVRLADMRATTEAILHHPAGNLHVCPWSRRQILDAVLSWVDILRYTDRPALIGGGVRNAVLVEAIEGNPYFVRMSDGDPRFNAGAIKRADALRLKLIRAIGQHIGPVPLGAGRKRRRLQNNELPGGLNVAQAAGPGALAGHGVVPMT